jgi:hypothetical protein
VSCPRPPRPWKTPSRRHSSRMKSCISRLASGGCDGCEGNGGWECMENIIWDIWGIYMEYMEYMGYMK